MHTARTRAYSVKALEHQPNVAYIGFMYIFLNDGCSTEIKQTYPLNKSSKMTTCPYERSHTLHVHVSIHIQHTFRTVTCSDVSYHSSCFRLSNRNYTNTITLSLPRLFIILPTQDYISMQCIGYQLPRFPNQALN